MNVVAKKHGLFVSVDAADFAQLPLPSDAEITEALAKGWWEASGEPERWARSLALRFGLTSVDTERCVRRFGSAADAVIAYAQSVNLDPLTFPPSPKSTEAQR